MRNTSKDEHVTWIPFMWIPLDMHHPPKHHCRPSTLLQGNEAPWWQWLPQYNNAPSWSAKKAQKNSSLRHRPGLWIPKIPIRSSFHDMCCKKSDPWRAHLRNHRTHSISCQLLDARHQNTPQEFLRSCHEGSESILIPGGSSVNHICSDMSHRCSNRIGIWGIQRPGQCLELLYTFLALLLSCSCIKSGTPKDTSTCKPRAECKFPRSALRCKKMINVIHFTC